MNVGFALDYIGEIVSLGIALGVFSGVLTGMSVPAVLY